MAIAKLFELALGKGMKFGLETMHQLDALFDFPSKSFLSVHVGGTNGKGSTTCKIAHALRSAERNIGVYTSPHIASVRERVVVNGECISVDDMSSLLEEIFAKCVQAKLQPTFFEVMTILSFLYFRKRRVDVAVVEVGLGGRLDATNILNPLLSIITSIGYDHTHYLGNTLEEISVEKGGIIKEGVPILLGPVAANQKILHRMAARRNSPCYLVSEHFQNYEQENRAIAKKALDILPFKTFLEEGLLQTPLCRFEHFQKGNSHVILDVAHNLPAMEALFARLDADFPDQQCAFVVGFSADKDVEALLSMIMKKASCIYLVKASHARAFLPQVGASYLHNKGFKYVIVEENMIHAIEMATKEHSLVIATGSFYIMKAVKSALGISQESEAVVFPH